MNVQLLRTSLSMAGIIVLTGITHAKPEWNGDCASCHRDSINSFNIINEDGTGGPGGLEFFDVLPQSNVALSIDVFYRENDKYSAILLNGSSLPFTQGPSSDVTWKWDTSGPDHFYTNKTSTLRSYTFDLSIADEASGFYPFTFTVAGGDSEWAQSRNFYVHVLANTIAGDFDQDEDVDGADFLKWQRGELSNPLSAEDLADWQANFGAGGSSVAAASTAVPEPATLLLAMLGLSAVGITHLRKRMR